MSEIRANTVSNAAGTGPATLTGQYAAKAWANFNGTGTVAIRESGNVGSITDNGTGVYTINLTTSLADANYAVTGSANDATSNYARGVTPQHLATNTSSSCRIATTQTFGTGDKVDHANVWVTFIR